MGNINFNPQIPATTTRNPIVPLKAPINIPINLNLPKRVITNAFTGNNLKPVVQPPLILEAAPAINPIGFNKTKQNLNNTFQQNYSQDRQKALDIYSGKEYSNYFYIFNSNGEIEIFPRNSSNFDLSFLDHIRTHKYKSPVRNIHNGRETFDNQGENAIVSEDYIFPNGAKYQPVIHTVVRQTSGHEVIIINRETDAILKKTIDCFKDSIKDKNYTSSEIIKKLLQFIDEIFTVHKDNNELASDKELLNLTMEHFDNEDECNFGEIINSGAGVCRHRALLTKLILDEIGLKTRIINGFYFYFHFNSDYYDPHSWNEIISNEGKTYLFDSMHRTIIDISDTNTHSTPQAQKYRLSHNNKDSTKYIDWDSPIGYIYRYMIYKKKISTSAGDLIPDESNGYIVKPIETNEGFIKINGKPINEETKANIGDWIQIKDKDTELGFQIIKPYK